MLGPVLPPSTPSQCPQSYVAVLMTKRWVFCTDLLTIVMTLLRALPFTCSWALLAPSSLPVLLRKAENLLSLTPVQPEVPWWRGCVVCVANILECHSSFDILNKGNWGRNRYNVQKAKQNQGMKDELRRTGNWKESRKKGRRDTAGDWDQRKS